MSFFRVLFIACAAAFAAWSGPVYQVNVDTGTLAGTDGAIYLQFAPGLNADLASVTISDFALGIPGALSMTPPLVTGGVTGALDAPPLVLDNSGALNDYLHFLTYGATLSFQVEFTLPGTLVGDSGSAFLLGLTGPDGLSPVLTSDPGGFLVQISYDYTGKFTAERYGSAANFGDVPEPGYAAAVAGVLLLTAGFARQLRSRR